MKVMCEVSVGELFDKFTILDIKLEKIVDAQKLILIKKEWEALQSKIDDLNIHNTDIYLKDLKEVNLKLWEIEDLIREKERQSQFDEEFITLARSVYITNDQRFDVKNRINSEVGSSFKEVKSYSQY